MPGGVFVVKTSAFRYCYRMQDRTIFYLFIHCKQHFEAFEGLFEDFFDLFRCEFCLKGLRVFSLYSLSSLAPQECTVCV